MMRAHAASHLHSAGCHGWLVQQHSVDSAPSPAAAQEARQRVDRPVRAARRRRGLSLLEVLISMFVLLIGLVGVSCMLPAGKFEIQQGLKIDYGTMVGRAELRDVKTRGFLKTTGWYDATTGLPQYVPSTTTQVMLAIDPKGIAAGYGSTFPNGASSLSLRRISPWGTPLVTTTAQLKSIADAVFLCQNDLVLVDNANKDLPPNQFMSGGSTRAFVGSYSWLATIVGDPLESVPPANNALMADCTVSVAVFFKRDTSTAGAGESIVTTIKFPGISYINSVDPSGNPVLTPYWGTEVQLTSITKPVKPGQWIALAGTIAQNPVTTSGSSLPMTANLSYFRWYRVVAADVLDASNNQNVTLAGPDWPVLPPSNNNALNPSQAWIIDNVIAVYEKSMRLETQ